MIGRRYSKVLKNICEEEKISLEARTFGVACISSIIAIDAAFRTIMNQSDNKSTVSASFTVFFSSPFLSVFDIVIRLENIKKSREEELPLRCLRVLSFNYYEPECLLRNAAAI